jgi:hypothetical protein
MVTTYLTVRQSMKRGMMPAATPDNPMGQSQKYMAYIMPFFALTGLYWPFGLVLYWVTTNVWTLIQQFVLFKRYPYTPPSAVGADAGVAAGAGTAALAGKKPAPKGGLAAMARAARQQAQANGTGSQNGKGSAGQNGRGASSGGKPASGQATGAQNGGGMLSKLGRGRPAEPELTIVEPEVKVVRQQPQRQSRSKRSGKH